MKNILQISLSLTLIFLLSFCSCKKETSPELNDVTVTINGEPHGIGIQLNWTQTFSADFREYIVVRSKSPLALSYEPNIASNLIVCRSSDAQVTKCIDRSLPAIEDLYYTLFIDLGNRYLRSEEILVKHHISFVDGYYSDVNLSFNHKHKLVYFESSESNSMRKLEAYDIESGEVIGGYEFAFIPWLYRPVFALSKIDGIDELYLGNKTSNGLECDVLDALTLERKRSIDTLGWSMGNVQFHTNKLGHLCVKGSSGIGLKIIDTSTGDTFASFGSSFEGEHLFNIDNDDLQFIAITSERMEYRKFKENGNFAGINDKNIDKETSLTAAVAPDGQSFLAFKDGTIYNKDFEEIGQIGTGEDDISNYGYSVDGQSIFVHKWSSSIIEQYRTSDLQLEEKLRFNFPIIKFSVEGKRMIVIGRTGGRHVIKEFDYTL